MGASISSDKDNRWRIFLGNVGFEDFEAMFEFPLLRGSVAGLQEVETFCGGVLGAQGLIGTGGDGASEVVRLLPEAGAGKEAVFEAGAGHVFQVEVAEVEFECGAGVLVGEVDTGDALVVSRECDGDFGGTVDGQRMILSGDAEDAVVGGEVDLDHDVALGELGEEGFWVALVHDVDAVADAFGVAEVDGFADVEAETGGRDKAGGQLASVERDVDVGIDAVEEVEHEHLAVILGHGHVGVFGLDEVDAEYVGVG